MQWIILERLEPYEVKVSSTVLRRGRRSDPALLSDQYKWKESERVLAYAKHYRHLKGL